MISGATQAVFSSINVCSACACWRRSCAAATRRSSSPCRPAYTNRRTASRLTSLIVASAFSMSPASLPSEPLKRSSCSAWARVLAWAALHASTPGYRSPRSQFQVDRFVGRLARRMRGGQRQHSQHHGHPSNLNMLIGSPPSVVLLGALPPASKASPSGRSLVRDISGPPVYSDFDRPKK